MRTSGLAVLVFVAVAIGCTSAPEERTLCDDAADHLGACLGKSIAPAPTCDAEAAALAAQALSTTCDVIRAVDAKSDGQTYPLGTVACIALAVPVFAHGLAQGAVCCFDYNCDGELVCNNFVCKPKAPLGGKCERENHCQGDLGCNQDRCIVKLGEGKACDRQSACKDDLVCAGGKCSVPLTDGASCKESIQCESARCYQGACRTENGLGDACGAEAGPCEAFLSCINGTCGTPGTGEACDPEITFACSSNETCWERKCEARHPEGGKCHSIFDCQFGLFCNGSICGH